MSDIPAGNYAQRWAEDTRQLPPLVADERETLVGFLDWHRKTLELKCSGVPSERLPEQSIPPSGLCLQGLVRHLPGVERWWFRQQFGGEDLPQLYYSDDDPDQDFEAHGGDFGEDLRVWLSECEAAREVGASASSLDQTGMRRQR